MNSKSAWDYVQAMLFPAPSPTKTILHSYLNTMTLSIRQPWAWLIVQGLKDIENRTWNTDYRGPLLIHAGQNLERGYKQLCQDFADAGIVVPDDLPRGAIVGKVDLTDVITRKRRFRDDWFTGPYGFVLRNPTVLPPLATKGELGLFTANYRATGPK